MRNLKKRVLMPTPNWFKRIIHIGLLIGATGGALLVSNIALPGQVISDTSTWSDVSPINSPALPTLLTTIAGYMVAIGAIAAAVAKTAINHE